MKKFLIVTLFTFALFFKATPVLACTTAVSPAVVGGVITVTFSGLVQHTTYNRKGIFTDSAGVMTTILDDTAVPTISGSSQIQRTAFRPGIYQFGISNIPSGGSDSCGGQVTVSSTPPASGPSSGIPAPKDWLPFISPSLLGFGPAPVLGLSFFKQNLAIFLIDATIFLVFLCSLIFLLIGAIRLITSGGDKEGTAKAKFTITYSLIGLALGLSSFVILGILSYFFGFKF